MEETFDIIIVGAGLAGVAAGYRVQTLLPTKTFTILEGKNRMGGTWNLFKYPGIRCDTDLVTYSYPFAPWPGDTLVSGGAKILEYIRNTAATNNLEEKIRFNHKVLSANWSSEKKLWTLTVSVNGEEMLICGRFIMWASGYFDHKQGLKSIIPGIENFEGTVVHPQFWPESLDYENKEVVIIGSGATAVTMLPAMTEKAAHVTMLQRSPGYLLTIPTKAPEDVMLRRYLPSWISSRLVRWKHIFITRLIVEICHRWPEFARRRLRAITTRLLPAHVPHNPHFEPNYPIGTQRLCLTPDGDFFEALRTTKASIVTDTIKEVTKHGIELNSGNRLNADVIVTATGLRIQLFGGAQISVDGRLLNPHDKYVWNGCMLQDVPNAAMMIGYTNASWTLGTDIIAQLAIRLMKIMEEKGATVLTPKLDEKKEMRPVPLLDIRSTYIRAAAKDLPKAAHREPWGARSGYYEDCWKVRFGDLTKEAVFE
ncbi:hypothetical protein ABW19_dt0204260 [Dactylella cylindrospora]|nr:hypothetical protein ABW19_dt0204260 [Dactylella cylindrospora]